MAKRRAKKSDEQGDGDPRAPGRLKAAGQIERAMLELVGERGFANVTIAAVLARSGSNRAQFYASFDGKAACFEAAYAASADVLATRLLAGCEEGSPWATGLRRGLEELSSFLAEEPALARGVFAEARGVGDRVAEKRDEVVGRLTRAADRARREIPGSRHAPPPITARFILSAIEASVHKSLADPDGRDFRGELAGVLYMAVDLYLGPEAARAEVRALGMPD